MQPVDIRALATVIAVLRPEDELASSGRVHKVSLSQSGSYW